MKTAKVENAKHGWKAKTQIRRNVLELLGPQQTRVFDAFAGPGLMWEHVWKDAALYVGCDERWYREDTRCCYVADNRRVLRSADLSVFNCFDLDAYGSPWEQALIIAARRRVKPGERLGLVVTEGTSLKRFGGLPHAMRQAAGLSRAGEMGAGRMHDEVIARALGGIVRRMKCRIVTQWRAVGVTGASPRYIGVVIEAV